MRVLVLLACLALSACGSGLQSCNHLVVQQLTRQFKTQDGVGEIKRTETYCYSTGKAGLPQLEE